MSPLSGSSFTGQAEFIDNAGNKTLIGLENNGTLSRQDPTLGTPVAMSRGLAVTDSGAMMKSWTVFGRIFFSFFNDPFSTPTGPIRHWDGHIDVAPNPPAAGTAVDSATTGSVFVGVHQVKVVFEMQYGLLSKGGATFSWNAAGGKQATFTIPLGPAGCVARRLLITTAGGNTFYYLPQGNVGSFRIADNVTTQVTIDFTDTQLLAFAADSTFLVNGPWVPTLPHFAPDGPGAAPTAQDSVVASAAGMVAGVHQVAVVFETIWGYLTVPSPVASWTAAGGFKVLINNIPLGPWYVLARRLIFTVSSGSSFFYISAGGASLSTTFRISDNTSTSFTVDFNDTALLQGSNVDYLFANISPGDSIGVESYNLRMTTWGGLNIIRGANSSFNLDFDGGFNTTGEPLGWTQGTNFVGGQKEYYDTYTGQSWKILGDGFNPIKGEIRNAQIAAVLSIGVPYTISAQIKPINVLANYPGIVEFDLFSPSLSFTYGKFSVPLSSLVSGNFQRLTGLLTAGLSNIPSDLVLRVYIDGTPNTASGAIIDRLQIYPTNNPIEASILHFSNVGDPETINGTTGFQQVSKDDGQKIIEAKKLRSFLYVYKERSMHVTVDDGIQEPAFWTVRELDSAVGAGSPNAVDSTESFHMTASRAGAYMFSGGRPVKISQEIQTTWESINWQFSDTISLIIDSQRKLIYIAVPLNNGSIPVNSLILDYSEGMGEEEDPGGRKWGFDGYAQPIRNFMKFENNPTTQSLFGQRQSTQSIYAAGNKIYEHISGDDDGIAIDSFYDTAFLKAGDRGTDLYGGVSAVIEGTGSCQFSIRGLDDVNVELLLPVLSLIPLPGFQYDIYGEMETERAKVRVESNVLGTSFKLKSLSLWAQPWSEIRPQPFP